MELWEKADKPEKEVLEVPEEKQRLDFGMFTHVVMHIMEAMV